MIYFDRISWIAYAADFWVYPFLRLMPNSGKVAFFTLASCLSAFLYLLGKWMTLFIWGGEVKPVSRCSLSAPWHQRFFASGKVGVVEQNNTEEVCEGAGTNYVTCRAPPSSPQTFSRAKKRSCRGADNNELLMRLDTHRAGTFKFMKFGENFLEFRYRGAVNLD